MIRMFERIGGEALYFLEQAGRMGLFLGSCLLQILLPPL